MKVYLIASSCDNGGTDVHAVETDPEKARKLYEIFSEVSDDVFIDEYDTDDNSKYLNGNIPYCAFFYKSGRSSRTHISTGWTGKFPHIDETKIYYRVHVRAASKDEAYQKAVVIHRDYVTK